MTKVRSGLEIFLETDVSLISKQRVGLVAHPASVLPDLTHSRHALLDAGTNLVALFALEHGLDGSVAETVSVQDEWDQSTGLPIYSLFGDKTRAGELALADMDVIIFDIQDVGARYFSYLATLILVLKFAASNGNRLFILDRPNPIDGVHVEGPMVKAGYESRVGAPFIPIRHAMTLGELGLFFRAQYNLSVDMNVIKMDGWQRDMWFSETGLPWVAPSPSLAHLSAVALYPGTCLLEATNLSEGRGTALPFEILGAPWLDSESLAVSLNHLDLPGIRFRAITFQPLTGAYKGMDCRGVQLHLINHTLYNPVSSILKILDVIRKCSQNVFKFKEDSPEGDKPHVDLLFGSADLRQVVGSGEILDGLLMDWRRVKNDFCLSRAPYLLY